MYIISTHLSTYIILSYILYMYIYFLKQRVQGTMPMETIRLLSQNSNFNQKHSKIPRRNTDFTTEAGNVQFGPGLSCHHNK